MSQLHLPQAGPTNDLISRMQSSSTGDMCIRNFCHEIIQQPNIEVPKSIIKELPLQKYLDDAKSHAQDYNTNINPKMIKVLTDIKNYSTRNIYYGDKIRDELEIWDKDPQNKNAKEEVKRLLEKLRTSLQRNRDHVDEVRNSLIRFENNLTQDGLNFSNAVITSERIIQSDTGRLADIKTGIQSYDDSIRNSTIAIAGSSFLGAAGVVTIVVGLVAELPSFLTSTKVVVAGAVMVVGGVTGIGISTGILIDSINRKAELLKEEAQIEGVLLFLPHINVTIVNLASSAKSAAIEVNNIGSTWSLISNKINYVISSVDDARKPDELPDDIRLELGLAKQLWNDVESTATKVENTLINVKTSTLTDENGKLIPFTR
ncbi:MAG TPA: HBL/NHE enterotoxin family protein, partial [Nostocaceae cyanobacterium]|nr:HBL/NHE enterotoxin family protein [Nostocaceae cyanobacterium]